MRERRNVAVEGIVQGVGFRPFVHALATRRRLAGRVRNDASGVRIEVEGDPAALDAFLDDLVRRAPPPARVDRVRVEPAAPLGAAGFRIEASRTEAPRTALVAADLATCEACLAELRDPADRRYRYPFLNCTHCGPRLTIVSDLPYDRPRTTMAGFPMCEACRREYEDPTDRRFHAQPTACPDCGPRLALREPDGRVLARAAAVAEPGSAERESDPLLRAASALLEGRVVAVKGLGGYHLACDATDEAAVRRLRDRKRREAKPLAIMVSGLEEARALCVVGEREAALLLSPRRPIVLLGKRSPAGGPSGEPAAGSPAGGSTPADGSQPAVADAVAPGNRRLGVMLPYTPLHHLLLEAVGRPLVMTSGNRTEEPIAYRDDDAPRRLGGIADLFLTHDRPIETRCDDSVVRVVLGEPTPLRRSRGYAPEPVPLPEPSPAPLLAVGGHLKNVFCLVREDRAFLGHHVGDLEHPSAYAAFEEGIAHYERLFGIRPEVVAHDLHPGYLSTRYSLEREDVRRIGVQHHHAHVAACLAEGRVEGPAIGVAFDGTGYGPDGAVWGGEFLVADRAGFERVGHLAYVPLPGGEAAIREPWRVAAAHLQGAFDADPVSLPAGRRLAAAAGERRFAAVLEIVRKGVRSPPTSSVGRLFDAVSALLGLRLVSRFEAEAAIELEMAADPDAPGGYPISFVPDDEDGWIWDPGPLLRGLLEDAGRGVPVPTLAGRFHNAVAAAIVVGCDRIREARGLERVVLTGGVFQNGLLLEKAVAGLEASGFEALLHRLVPPNDGGLAYGQAAVACARLAAGLPEEEPEASAAPTGRPVCV